MYQKGKLREREKMRQGISLVHSLYGHNGQVWYMSKPGARNPNQFPPSRVT